jgi:hypothetical protein
MSNVTPKGNYPYPDPSDPVSDYPATASTFAGYVDNLPNRNLIINPLFDIWQRGTSPATTTSGSYTADRWRLDWDGTAGTRAVSATTPTLGTSIGGMQPYRAANINVSTLATGQSFMRFAQRIEGVRSLAGETATLSFYVSSTAAPKTVTIRAVQNFGTGGSPSSAVTTAIGTATTTTSYVRKTFTFTVPALTSKTIGNNGDDYLEIHFDLGTQTGTFNLWGVQLEQNSTATALERRPIEQELALCQRYYQYIPNYADAWPGVMFTTTSARFSLKFPVLLRVNPIVAIVRTAGGSNVAACMINGSGNAAYTSSGVSAPWGSVNGYTIDLTFTSTGFAAGQAVLAGVNAGYELQFSAEL